MKIGTRISVPLDQVRQTAKPLSYQGTRGMTPRRIRAAAARARITAQVSREIAGAGLAAALGRESGTGCSFILRDREFFGSPRYVLLEPIQGCDFCCGMRSDSTNDEKSRRWKRRLRGESRQVCGMGGLIRLRGFGDYVARRFGCEAGFDQPAGDFGIVGTWHVDDDGGIRSDGYSGKGARVFRTGEGCEEHARGEAAVRERNLRGGSSAKGGGDTGNNFKLYVGRAKGIHLFGRAAEQERVATFEANYDFVFACGFDEQSVDFRLGEETEACSLANVDALCACGYQGENFRRYERVMKNDVRRLKNAQGLDGEKVGISGAGADQENSSREQGHQEAPL